MIENTFILFLKTMNKVHILHIANIIILLRKLIRKEVNKIVKIILLDEKKHNNNP